MNVFISADIEGTCGITDWSETERSTPYEYNYFRKQMTMEAKAACEGALSGGADQILVKDAHDSARNLDPSQLPEVARVLRGWSGDPLSMMSGLDQGSYDAVFFTGYHAWASCGGNPLSHTMNLKNDVVVLNGVRMSEFLMNAYTAAYYQVPVAFLSGDKALCDFAKELIPNITTVAVNEGRGGSVVSMHPDAAIRAIKEGTKKAVKNAKKCYLTLPEHFEVTIRFREHKRAYDRHFYPGATLEDEKNVCFASGDWYEMLRFFHFVPSA